MKLQKFLTGFAPGLLITSIAIIVANCNGINNEMIFAIGVMLSAYIGIRKMIEGGDL